MYIHTHYRKKDSLPPKKLEVQLHSVACEAVVNPRALSSIRNIHNLKEWENASSERKFQSTKRKSGVREAREFA